MHIKWSRRPRRSRGDLVTAAVMRSIRRGGKPTGEVVAYLGSYLADRGSEYGVRERLVRAVLGLDLPRSERLKLAEIVRQRLPKIDRATARIQWQESCRLLGSAYVGPFKYERSL